MKNAYKFVTMSLLVALSCSSTLQAVFFDFGADEVLDHANTFPQNYDMNFLTSANGRAEIQRLIDDVNRVDEAQGPRGLKLIPGEYFPHLPDGHPLEGLNLSDPNASYNKSRIAMIAEQARSPEEKAEALMKRAAYEAEKDKVRHLVTPASCPSDLPREAADFTKAIETMQAAAAAVPSLASAG